jgi:hypothetical protein
MPNKFEKWLYGAIGLAIGICTMVFYIEFLQYHAPTPPEVDEMASMLQSIRNQQHADEEQMANIVRRIEEFNDKNIMVQGELEDDVIDMRNKYEILLKAKAK